MAPTILCVIDGLRPDILRPDALAQCETPVLDELVVRGRATLAARSVMPTVTLPCHMSIFHSVEPGRHGVVTNTWTPQVRPVPGLFDVARAAGLRTAAYYNWEELRDLWRPGALETGYFWRDNKSPAGDARVAQAAAEGLRADEIDLAFVYLGHVDEAGHRYGWLSQGYLEAVAHADTCIGLVLEAVGAEGTLLVTADHGGHDRSHGTDADADMLVPLVIAGRGVAEPGPLPEGVSLLDVAPTLATLHDLLIPTDWEGQSLL
jgi:predicted AlkP superfamily pyrophosphatase or phosphodiesterase